MTNMRNFYLCWTFLLLAAAGACGFSARAFAETKIAVVDVQKIMSESLGARSIQKQLEDKRKSFQEEFSKHEQDLRDEQKTLIEGREKMSAEDFSKKREAFEGELLEMRKLVQKRQLALEKGASNAIEDLRGEVVKIVAQLAEKNGYDIVLTKQNVILAEKEMDITPEVMTRLDKNLKQVELKVETN